MARPKGRPAAASKPGRTSTAIRFPVDVHERLVQEALDRDVSLNWIVVRLVREGLDRIVPVDDLKLTRD